MTKDGNRNILSTEGVDEGTVATGNDGWLVTEVPNSYRQISNMNLGSTDRLGPRDQIGDFHAECRRLELISHSREQVVVSKWLRQKSHVRGNQLHVQKLSREAAHENDGQSGMEPGQGSSKLPAVHYRHPQVRQYQADLLVGAMSEKLKCACPIWSIEHGIALILKQSANDAPQAVLVLHHEHGLSGLRTWAFAVHAIPLAV